VDTPRNQHGKHAVTPRNRFLDNLTVIRCSGNDGDPSLKRIELAYAALPANTNHLVAPAQRVLYHILPKLPGCPYNTDILNIHLVASSITNDQELDKA
jgi:hypothetical protein